jgi:ankyrin repeat protein
MLQPAVYNIPDIDTPEARQSQEEAIEELQNYIAAGVLFEVKHIIKRSPKLLSCTNSLDQTPLHLACLHGHYDIIRFLLGEGADSALVDCRG